MEHHNSSIYRIAYTILPVIITASSILLLAYKRYGSKYATFTEINSITISIQKRRLTLMFFTSIQTMSWLWRSTQYLLGSNHLDINTSISLACLFITWLTLLVLSILSPRRNHYRDRVYNYIFTFDYCYLFLDSAYRLLSTDKMQNVDACYCAISLIVFVIAGTTPQSLHPRDLQAASYEKLEIKDGTVYRNNLALSPETTASIFSWCSFQWMNPLVVFGFHNVITRENIYAMTFQHLCRPAYEDFVDTAAFMARAKVLHRIYRANKSTIWYQFIFSMIACFVAYLSLFFQQKFLQYIEQHDDKAPIQTAYLYVLGFFLVGLVKMLCSSIHMWMGRRWNIRTLIMLDSEIFCKTLKRKDMSGKLSKVNDDEQESFSNMGKITNLMSVDADKLSDIPNFIIIIYTAPVEITIAVAYLYNLLGNAALVGLAVMIMCFPLSGLLSKKMSVSYKALTTAKDRRNDLVNELLQGIRMIKYFAWEENWKEKVFKARRDEISKLIRTIVIDVLSNIIFLTVPVLVTVPSFIWYTKVAGNELTASVAFISITLFEMLRSPLMFIPESINTLTEAYVSLNRIASYLEEPEVEENINKEPVECPEGVDPQIVLARVGFETSVFQWHIEKIEASAFAAIDEERRTISTSSTSSTMNVASMTPRRLFQLNVPRFNFPTGKLSLVCGPTGSGKSSFLHALLGEMDIVSGRVYLPSTTVLASGNVSKVDPIFSDLYLDKVAYVAQQPFLRHASIRDNILFGLPFHASRYKKTLYQCALIKDLTIFPDGDLTEIGEKGISLSGGQKQRVSLARAVYSNAKTVLLDDCLSAVDAHTSKHIYKKCFKGDLLLGRTVILATHQVRLCLPGASFFIKIENGQVLGCDSVENLKANGELQKLLGAENQQEQEEEIEDIIDADNADADMALDKKTEAANKLVQEETSEKGQVKLKVYAKYLAVCGGWVFWIALVCSYVFARLLTFGENWWLRIWAASYDEQAPGNTSLSSSPQHLLLNSKQPAIQGVFDTLGAAVQKQNIFKAWVFEEHAPANVDYYIGIYIAICIAYILFDACRNILIYWGSIRGARRLFDSLLDRVIHAPMRFFDTTPVGRILNRFGKDVSTIDKQIARSASFLVECVTGIVASTIVISVITPQFFVVAVAISCLYFVIGMFYLRISRELKRLNSVSRSPIYSHFTESLAGVTTIRAYGVQEQFMRTVYEKIDAFVAPYYFLRMSNRWLCCRIEFIGAFVTLFTGIFLIVNIDYIDAGMAGISLFYARNFLEHIYWFIRQYTNVEMNLNSVERVQEYLELDQEPPATITGRRPPAAWPTTAAIEVKDLVIRYAPELDPVLHGISFSTRPHEKIGIVGRTGSGKSTMALSFFRFLEASHGSISIDGIDISTIGIQDLRSRITIIPQDVVLFSGTIRSNIDPFEEHSDQAVWESLERAHLCKAPDRLKKLQSSSSSGSGSVDDEQPISAITSLNQQVSDGGNNFSQGQRQLLCLARALLKNSKLIIMDEATASVDFDTDAKIQRTIREEFTNSTLLCIAHRLRTIIDYDRILVLDQGRVAEYDTPYNLLVQGFGAGIFKSMCEKSGELEELLKMATESHLSREQDHQISADSHVSIY